MDGLRAPFILHPPKEVHTYDEEFTVILGDWYHEQHADLLKKFISISNPGGAEPVPGLFDPSPLQFVPYSDKFNRFRSCLFRSER